MLRIHNTLSREKEPFKPLQEGRVTMYCCGPTVYDTPHLGNYRSFVTSDNVRRYLEYLGYEVKQVMNITDIDDKTIRRSGEEGQPLAEYTLRYEKAFMDGLGKLNVLPAERYPRATENVDSMIENVEALERKGFAYESGGSVYFNVARFPDYGKLSGVDISSVRPGARVNVDEYDKENPRDFALMKRSTKSEVERGIYFDSKWGKVRPGWHIECSTLATKYLGATIDIHTGGVDLIFPHHENEIAQAESRTGERFVRYWIHGEHLMVDGEKMSKSIGNIVSLEDVLKEYSADVIRYMFASTHYRRTLDFTRETAENARNNYERLMNAYSDLLFAERTSVESPDRGEDAFIDEIEEAERRFRESMDDDFNGPAALGVFHDIAKSVNRYLLEYRNREVLQRFKGLFDNFAYVLGLSFPEPLELTPEQAEMIRSREELRRSERWQEADRIRSDLRAQGLILEDTDWGTKWRRA